MGTEFRPRRNAWRRRRCLRRVGRSYENDDTRGWLVIDSAGTCVLRDRQPCVRRVRRILRSGEMLRRRGLLPLAGDCRRGMVGVELRGTVVILQMRVQPRLREEEQNVDGGGDGRGRGGTRRLGQ